MTVSYASVFTPMAAELPPDTDLGSILVDLTDNHVAAPKGVDQSGLAAAAQDSLDNGIPLSIVVVPGNPSPDSSLRDLATEVGKVEHGTVLVLGDDWAGTYSSSIPRYRLEKAEDVAKYQGHGHSAEAAQAFVNRLDKPDTVSWTTVTAVLLAGLVIVIAGLYVVKSRRAGDRELARN
ncbi:Rv1476 family membrane protein [Nocardia sp. NPDC003482]|uniref:Rv1476 family membrane protein n=1 Tax=Nocardia sp. NPDC004068 TaxID=3364303 RepID=UPI0036C84382